MVGGGLSRPNDGQKVGCVLLLHFFGGSHLGDFPMISCSSIGRSRFVFVLGIEESLVEVSLYQVPAWAGHTEGRKLIACCYFLLLRCSGELLLEVFPATKAFFGCGFLMGFVPVYEGNLVEVVVFSDGLDQQNRGRKERCLLALHNFGQHLLEAFPMMEDFSGGLL